MENVTYPNQVSFLFTLPCSPAYHRFISRFFRCQQGLYTLTSCYYLTSYKNKILISSNSWQAPFSILRNKWCCHKRLLPLIRYFYRFDLIETYPSLGWLCEFADEKVAKWEDVFSKFSDTCKMLLVLNQAH